jgi:hypothetical protein
MKRRRAVTQRAKIISGFADAGGRAAALALVPGQAHELPMALGLLDRRWNTLDIQVNLLWSEEYLLLERWTGSHGPEKLLRHSLI